MKNVTKILTAAVLCAALFASTQRTNALGSNPAFWPGDEANIAAFPAQINNHAHAQFSSVNDADNVNTDLVFNHNGTAWSFGFTEGDGDTWFDLGWGKNGMGINVKMVSSDNGSDVTPVEASGNLLSYGNTFDWGELGVHYASGDGVGIEGITANYRKACGFWVFNDMVASLGMPDDGAMTLTADWFTHWDASGADVMLAMGIDYADSDDAGANGHIKQTAAVGVEANLTDWATFRAGLNWEWQLSGDSEDTGSNEEDAEGWNMGLGFNWGGFNVDFDMGDLFFADPMGHFTGFANDGTFGKCTLTYNF